MPVEVGHRQDLNSEKADNDGDGIVTVNEHLAAIGADTTDEDGEPMPVKVVDPARHQASLRVSFNLSDKDDSGCLEREAWEND